MIDLDEAPLDVSRRHAAAIDSTREAQRMTYAIYAEPASPYSTRSAR